MAHLAIQVGNLTIDLEDEDEGIDKLNVLGRELFNDLVEIVDVDDEEDDD